MRWRDNPGAGGVSLKGNYQCGKQQQALLPLVRRAIEFHTLSNQESGLRAAIITSALQLPARDPSVPLSFTYLEDGRMTQCSSWGWKEHVRTPKVLEHVWIVPSKHLIRGPQKNVVMEYLPSSLFLHSQSL